MILESSGILFRVGFKLAAASETGKNLWLTGFEVKSGFQDFH